MRWNRNCFCFIYFCFFCFFFSMSATDGAFRFTPEGRDEGKHLKSCGVILKPCLTHLKLCTLFFAGWFWITCRSLGISCLHPLDVLLADHLVLHYGMRVVFAHDASGSLLEASRCLPGLIDVLSRELLQMWKVLSSKTEKADNDNVIQVRVQTVVLPDVVSIFVCLLSKGHRRVDPEELMKKSTG